MWLDKLPSCFIGKTILVGKHSGPTKRMCSFGLTSGPTSGPTSYRIPVIPWQNCHPQVVRAMLESSMKERQTQRIQLNDTPREAVSLLLEILLLVDWIFWADFLFWKVVTFWKHSWEVSNVHKKKKVSGGDWNTGKGGNIEKYIHCISIILQIRAEVCSFGWAFGVQIPPLIWCLEAWDLSGIPCYIFFILVVAVAGRGVGPTHIRYTWLLGGGFNENALGACPFMVTLFIFWRGCS